jgi:hypothetical protein
MFPLDVVLARCAASLLAALAPGADSIRKVGRCLCQGPRITTGLNVGEGVRLIASGL